MKKIISVKVPGSTSNLGPGFDTLGLAVNMFLNAQKIYLEWIKTGIEKLE